MIQVKKGGRGEAETENIQVLLTNNSEISVESIQDLTYQQHSN